MNYDFAAATQHFAARNAFTTGPHELLGLIEAKAPLQIVDVRYPPDFRAAHIPGAVNLPKNQWDHPAKLSKDKPVYLYCYNPQCHLAAEAAAKLVAQGFAVIEMEGGFSTWEAFGQPVVTSAPAAAAA
jgi:rhodanese-related sulfurtransferase